VRGEEEEEGRGSRWKMEAWKAPRLDHDVKVSLEGETPVAEAEKGAGLPSLLSLKKLLS
jgi:hypothetical protein